MNANRIAVIDVGTNTTRLAVFETSGRSYRLVEERSIITRLGQGFGASRTLTPEAEKRTLNVLKEYAETSRRLGVSGIITAGTAVLRKAQNAKEFLNSAAAIGVPLKVIPGEEEARLVFLGVSSGLDASKRSNLLTVDIGGGSTEFTIGGNGIFDRAVSLDIGAVVMTERFLKSDPPEKSELQEMEAHIRETLKAVATVFRGGERTVVGVAGTITTLAALDLELPDWNPDRVHGHTLTAVSVRKLYDKLSSMTVAQRRDIPAMEIERADIIAAGAGILDALMTDCGISSMEVSLRDIRYGLMETTLGEQ